MVMADIRNVLQKTELSSFRLTLQNKAAPSDPGTKLRASSDIKKPVIRAQTVPYLPKKEYSGTIHIPGRTRSR